MKQSISSSIEHKRSNLASRRIDKAQIVPLNSDKGRAMSSEIKLDTHDTLRAGESRFNRCSMEKTSILDTGREGSPVILIKGESGGHAGSSPVQPTYQSPDPAGLFSENSVPSIPTIPHNSTPAVDNHRSNADVWNLNQLHKANNCNNCSKLNPSRCSVHKYALPFKEIDCEQWEYRGKKA